jgi:hypothetical protein
MSGNLRQWDKAYGLVDSSVWFGRGWPGQHEAKLKLMVLQGGAPRVVCVLNAHTCAHAHARTHTLRYCPWCPLSSKDMVTAPSPGHLAALSLCTPPLGGVAALTPLAGLHPASSDRDRAAARTPQRRAPRLLPLCARCHMTRKDVAAAGACSTARVGPSTREADAREEADCAARCRTACGRRGSSLDSGSYTGRCRSDGCAVRCMTHRARTSWSPPLQRRVSTRRTPRRAYAASAVFHGTGHPRAHSQPWKGTAVFGVEAARTP